jgi:hypothetical protein
MADQPQVPMYRIYLLTVWQEQEVQQNGPQSWRFQLADPRTGQRYGFSRIESLLATVMQLHTNKEE